MVEALSGWFRPQGGFVRCSYDEFRHGWIQGLEPRIRELTLSALLLCVCCVLRQVYATSTASQGEGESPETLSITRLSCPFPH